MTTLNQINNCVKWFFSPLSPCRIPFGAFQTGLPAAPAGHRSMTPQGYPVGKAEVTHPTANPGISQKFPAFTSTALRLKPIQSGEPEKAQSFVISEQITSALFGFSCCLCLSIARFVLRYTTFIYLGGFLPKLRFNRTKAKLIFFSLIHIL